MTAAAIHSIDHFALNLPDLARAERFISAVGLGVERVGEELRVRAIGNDHVWGRILCRPQKSLAYLSLGCYAQDLESLKRQVIAAGGALTPPHPTGGADGFWFHDPDGNLVQVKVAAKTQPDQKDSLRDASVPAARRGAVNRSKAPMVHPTRLSHILLFTPDVSRAVDFYRDAVGLNLSDRSGEIIAFMHAPHGCDHHLVAFAKSGAKGIHHTSWDVSSFDDVGLAYSQMRGAGHTEQWGVARHVLGSNYFVYTRDPWGSWWEHSCHIDYVPAGTQWEAGDHPPEDSLYLWGPDVPANFVENVEA